MAKYVGIDPGSSVIGWALFEDETILRAGVIKLPAKTKEWKLRSKKKKSEKIGWHLKTGRLGACRTEIEKLFLGFPDPIDKVIIEDSTAALGGKSLWTTLVASYYFSIIVDTIQHMGFDCFFQSPRITRKTFGLKQNCKKNILINRLKEQFQVDVFFKLKINKLKEDAWDAIGLVKAYLKNLKEEE